MSSYVNERVTFYTYYKNYISAWRSYYFTETQWTTINFSPSYSNIDTAAPQAHELLVLLNSDYSYSFKSPNGYYLASNGDYTYLSGSITEAAKWTVSSDTWIADDRVCLRNVKNGKFMTT